MPSDVVPADVRALLEEHIETYEQLETLLLLRAHPGEWWTPESVGARLGISVGAAARALDEIYGSAFLTSQAVEDGRRFMYGPAPVAAASIDRLKVAYDERRIEIMKIMNESAIARLRTAAIRAFADAFLLGSKK